ncbi:MAG: Mitochondrial distribution and morphology protein 10 [Trizodia sp. TS-e1964]|nr:MAG: Mitochondrial distribution and morphology protein 10 [Trizodia sp. TS-e1964]
MLTFMDQAQLAFQRASAWPLDNSYSTLTSTAQALLDFTTPRGLQFHVSSLSTPQLGTSYTLGSAGALNGSLSYLYSSIPLPQAASRTADLHTVVPGYRHVQDLQIPGEAWAREVWRAGKRVDRRDTLLYGRLYLPTSSLEALYQRRLTPTQQLLLSCVSSASLPHGGTLLAQWQHDAAKHSSEILYSSDGALVGLRGLYNIGSAPPPAAPFRGRFSAGAELYYGALNKSGGFSAGARFTTLPGHVGIPLTVTLTLNPLMGSVSGTYAVHAGRQLALASRFDFNMFSYESDLVLGMEFWRRRAGEGGVAGVLKARADVGGKVGVLWEGRFKELLFSLGSSFDLLRRDQPFRAVGLEVQYSS